jgi:hypothetical protein
MVAGPGGVRYVTIQLSLRVHVRDHMDVLCPLHGMLRVHHASNILDGLQQMP